MDTCHELPSVTLFSSMQTPFKLIFIAVNGSHAERTVMWMLSLVTLCTSYEWMCDYLQLRWLWDRFLYHLPTATCPSSKTHNLDHITEKNNGHIASLHHRLELTAASRLQKLWRGGFSLIGWKWKELYKKMRRHAPRWLCIIFIWH